MTLLIPLGALAISYVGPITGIMIVGSCHAFDETTRQVLLDVA